MTLFKIKPSLILINIFIAEEPSLLAWIPSKILRKMLIQASV
uniref:Uncharacterized protein n=1 Tax=Siphoviridae sp. ctjdk2 TaxID=2825635 RepID=A0A8S5UKS0_9CAUD|nr:MAG TPA: hypothetical protein [Siphoviridae sp. ctjdk2]DAZ22944.1 MAG TPA: hypothetical protein [Caudoviricetes sp.]